MSDLDLSNPYDPDQFPQEKRVPAAPLQPLRNADEIAASPPPASPSAAETSPGSGPPQGPPELAAEHPVPWKAAASSVPKLRQQPTALPDPAGPAEFQGFVQDSGELPGEEEDGTASRSARKPGAGSPLSAELPLWEAWLERARAVPRPILIGAGAGVLLIWLLVAWLVPHGPASIPLARIRQHPEAYDGRIIKVKGRAGETFSVGGNYMFDLRQGRDTIVVYSRTRRPSLHERVEATGMVSIGYLDGTPRLALFEEPQTP